MLPTDLGYVQRGDEKLWIGAAVVCMASVQCAARILLLLSFVTRRPISFATRILVSSALAKTQQQVVSNTTWRATATGTAVQLEFDRQRRTRCVKGQTLSDDGVVAPADEIDEALIGDFLLGPR